jgi:hypothetical protein
LRRDNRFGIRELRGVFKNLEILRDPLDFATRLMLTSSLDPDPLPWTQNQPKGIPERFLKLNPLLSICCRQVDMLTFSLGMRLKP